MRKRIIILAAALLAATPSLAQAAPADASAAVSNTVARTPDNVKLDESRKPVEVLQFFGLEQGMDVIDMFGANKYWAEIIAPAVGSAGHVTVWQPNQFLSDERRKGIEEFAAARENVTFISSPFEAPNLPANSFDFMIMNLDYHDVYLNPNEERGIVSMNADEWLKTLYAAMKPGAVVGVIDHVAAAGSNPRDAANELHRIDPAVVKADFERAGFVLEAESDLLRNPADDHTFRVFDPAIRGKTDRFMFRFRKPA